MIVLRPVVDQRLVEKRPGQSVPFLHKPFNDFHSESIAHNQKAILVERLSLLRC